MFFGRGEQRRGKCVFQRIHAKGDWHNIIEFENHLQKGGGVMENRGGEDRDREGGGRKRGKKRDGEKGKAPREAATFAFFGFRKGGRGIKMRRGASGWTSRQKTK